MKTISVVSVFILALALDVGADAQTRHCEVLKNDAVEFTSRAANLLPALNLRLQFEYDFDGDPASPFAGSEEESGSGIVIKLPDFCIFSDAELPEKELIYFIIGHEIGHSLIDLIPPMSGFYPTFSVAREVSELVKKRRPDATLSDPIISEIFEEILHMNTDSMGLLILQALNVNLKTVLDNSQDYLKNHPFDQGLDRLNDVFGFRFSYQQRMLGSPLSRFLPSIRICLLTPVREFLKRTGHEKDLEQLQGYFSTFTQYYPEPTTDGLKEASIVLSEDCYSASPKALADTFDWYIQENLKMGIEKLNTYKTLDLD